MLGLKVTSMILDQNSTTQSSITALLHSFSVKAQNSVAQILDFSVILHKYLTDPVLILNVFFFLIWYRNRKGKKTHTDHTEGRGSCIFQIFFRQDG